MMFGEEVTPMDELRLQYEQQFIDEDEMVDEPGDIFPGMSPGVWSNVLTEISDQNIITTQRVRVKEENRAKDLAVLENSYKEGMSTKEVEALQTKVGAKADGQWGPSSQFKADVYNTEAPKGSRIFASGRYQTIPSTLELAVKSGYIKADDVYNKDTQERTMDYLLQSKRKAVDTYIKGKGDIDKALLGLAKEWASMPSPIKTSRGDIGDSYWGGANKAGASLDDVKALLLRAKESGSDKEVRDFIAHHESGAAGYDAYNQGTSGNTIVSGRNDYDFSTMSINTILKGANNPQN